MRKVRIGIIGTGGIANAHAEGVQSLDDAELVAACDVIPGRGRGVCRALPYPRRLHRPTGILQEPTPGGGPGLHASPRPLPAGHAGRPGRDPRHGGKAADHRLARGGPGHRGGQEGRHQVRGHLSAPLLAGRPARQAEPSPTASWTRSSWAIAPSSGGATSPITTAPPGAAPGPARAAACWSTSRCTPSTCTNG